MAAYGALWVVASGALWLVASGACGWSRPAVEPRVDAASRPFEGSG
ncbi:hypothetical protein AB0H92_46230 [Streptomyces phaeochromogenes]